MPLQPPRKPQERVRNARRRRCVSKQAVFLAAFLEKASIPAALEAAEITLAQHQEWLVRDARYRERFSYAYRDVADGLRDEVARLAMGWEEQVLYRGRQCGTKPRHSDRLLMFLLRALKPEQYR
jgi:hypothetical protein